MTERSARRRRSTPARRASLTCGPEERAEEVVQTLVTKEVGVAREQERRRRSTHLDALVMAGLVDKLVHVIAIA